MPDILLPTKLLIPQTRPALVARSRLTDQLTQATYRTLTLVSAPAGFGKTTLAAEWAAGIRRQGQNGAGAQISWLSLDESDNDFQRFLSYFLTALLQLDPGDEVEHTSLLEMAQSPNPPPIEIILSPLISAFSSSGRQIILVLDDYHVVENQQVQKTIDLWLKKGPPQAHTLLLTREDPPFPLARLRAQNQLLELRAKDLRFTEPEAAQFLNDAMGFDLDPASIAALGKRTEGWIAGLQMAALSMRDRQDIHSFIESFSGTNRFILDFLLEEVLANQPEEVQEFLLQTSILKRFSAALCDAVLDQVGQAAAMLETLEGANLFLIPLDEKRSWYRYHHLFSDLLAARLGQTRTEGEISGLHSRAAAWYEKEGLAYQAIYHASLIPDDAWVERIIDQNYMEIFQRKDSVSIRQWTGELSPELVYQRPRLAIHEANSRAWFGQLNDAELLLDQAEMRLAEEDPSPETQAMEGYLAYVRSRVTAMRGDFQEAIELCLTAREKTPDSNQGLLGGIGVMLGYGYFLAGDFPRAEGALRETIRSGKRAGALNTTIGAYCVLGRLYAMQGLLQKSSDLYREGEAVIRESAAEQGGAMSIIDVGLAEILYERNRLEAALSHIKKGLEYLPLWSKADDIALAYVIQSRIMAARGELRKAGEIIEKASQVIHSSGVFPEARDEVKSAEVGRWLQDPDHPEINRWAKSIEEAILTRGTNRFEDELILITLARVWIAQGKLPEAGELLDRLEASAQAGGRGGRSLKILLLQALVRQAEGKPDRAFSLLEKALARGEPEGYARTFLDQGPPLKNLLAQWAARKEDHPLHSYASQLLAQFNDLSRGEETGESSPADQSGLIEPLTQRELEVLGLIAGGKTNKDIANTLVISPGTVKAHTSNIYRKLDVSNRTEAVSLARELGILP